jgi:hypothetical protein
MSRFNSYFANDFASCRLLAYARDPHRERDVRIYLMPGDIENVGVTDGVDKWICPVICNPFSVNIIQLVKDIQSGVVIPKPEPPGSQGKGARRRLFNHDVPTPQPAARRAILAPLEQTQPRSRRAVLSNI